MKESNVYDCIIIGGGLAGLSLSILLAQKKYNVLLIEKKSYPYHKVCGEYISMESWNFLQRIGIPLHEMQLPKIDSVKMTGITGNAIEEQLHLGGFGISRYTLDCMLASKAKELGVHVLENTTCLNYNKLANKLVEVQTKDSSFIGKILCATFGRHAFGNFYKPKRETENWIGVKYHIKGDFATNKIELHTFKHGYCGMSKVDDEKYCLCYLAKASLLKSCSNNIKEMEKQVLFQNPMLKEIFEKATFVFEKPLSISNITFSAKEPIIDDVFYIGDASGAIAPLTGNGMSNAMRGAFLLSHSLDVFFRNEIDFLQLKTIYRSAWNKEFKQRIQNGRMLQYFFCQPFLTPIFMLIMRLSKKLRIHIINQTHGKSF